MELNDQQKRALAVLEELLTPEEKIADEDIRFLTTEVRNPRWSDHPEDWADDWCNGWAFKPHWSFANALGISLLPRTRTIGHLVDEQFKPVPLKDSCGEIKKNKDGSVIAAPLIKRWNIWGQSSNFNFRAGYMIHSYPLTHMRKSWGEQLAYNQRFLKIMVASPAGADEGNKLRDPGFVKFELWSVNQHGMIGVSNEEETTQDGFIHFLITGELPEKRND